MTAPAPLVIHEHRHIHEQRRPERDREPPVRLDPLARYDAQGRKQPKRVFAGAMETVRALPWLLGKFELHVPEEEWTAQAGQAFVDCKCGEAVYVSDNGIERCQGECGRWFMYLNGRLRVAREPPT